MLFSQYKRIIAVFGLLALIDVVITLYHSPASLIRANYHVSAAASQALTFTLLIPFIIQIAIMLWAYLSVLRYSHAIAQSQEADAFRRYC